jgi:hypothetical protein
MLDAAFEGRACASREGLEALGARALEHLELGWVGERSPDKRRLGCPI